MKWAPDFCPGGQCVIEITREWTVVRFLQKCPRHAQVAGTDQEVFDLILQSSRVKEAARWALKLHMALDKEHPGLPWTVDDNGNFTIVTGLPANQRAAARNAVNTAIAAVRKPAGTSTVTVL